MDGSEVLTTYWIGNLGMGLGGLAWTGTKNMVWYGKSYRALWTVGKIHKKCLKLKFIGDVRSTPL